MTISLSPGEMRDALVAQGVPRDKAERAAGFLSPTANVVSAAAHLVPAITFPLRLTLPWSALCSDNDKYGATVVKNAKATYPKLLLKPEYREAKAKARKIARDVVGQSAPATAPLALHARVYVPDNRLGHDVCNFAKCCLDAFEEVIYQNDAQLHRVVWERAGVDVDAPRAEITVEAR